MKRAVFLDRDGTINRDAHYVHRIEDFEWLPGAVDGMRLLQENGFDLFVLTNQSGIARGYFSEEDYGRLTEYMLRELERRGVRLTAVYYCPHHPEAKVARYRMDCDCRKPAVGMFLRAAREHGVSLAESFAIGDRLRDLSVCGDGRCRGYLVSENEDPGAIDRVRGGLVPGVRWAPDLYGAARDIVSAERKWATGEERK